MYKKNNNNDKNMLNPKLLAPNRDHRGLIINLNWSSTPTIIDIDIMTLKICLLELVSAFL